MTELLKEKYKYDIFKKANEKADSLMKTEYWIRDAVFNEGHSDIINFILSKLSFGQSSDYELKTKILIEITIDSNGKVENPIIRKGINEEIDNQILRILQEMPEWKPAYLYGKPIKQLYVIPINIEYQ